MSGTSGRTSARQFAFYDPDTSSWRMWPDTGLWGSIEFSETWPRTGCMFDGRAFELPTSAPRITGNACSSSRSFPTPKAHDGEFGMPRTSGRPIEKSTHLQTIVAHHFPTPVAQPSGNTPEEHLRKKPGRTRVTDLAIVVENGLMPSGGAILPTPRTTDANGAGMHGTGGQDLRTTVTSVFPTPSAADGTGGKYNSTGHQSSLPGTVRELSESSGVPTPPLFDVGSD